MIEKTVVATAYGAWNDLIKDVFEPTDGQIIQDIYTNWHVSKQDVSEANWRRALQWLKDNEVRPDGNARASQV